MRIHPKRAFAVVAAAVMGFTALVAGGTAQAAETSNYASSHASGWHKSSFDVAFQVRQMFSNSVEAYNQADAVSTDCVGCRSVAIAFQIVADARVPRYVEAGNYASAVNEQCDGCQTLGVAYQFIIAKPTMLDWNDMAKLYQIDFKLQMLRWSHAPMDTVAGEVESYANDVAGILAHAGSGWHWPLVRHFIIWRH